MTSYESHKVDEEIDFGVSQQDLAGADYAHLVQRQLIAAFLRKAKEHGVTKAQLAKTLGVNRSTISRILAGNANLTSRTVGELCWALDVNPFFEARDFEDVKSNEHPPYMLNRPDVVVFSVGRSGREHEKTTCEFGFIR